MIEYFFIANIFDLQGKLLTFFHIPLILLNILYLTFIFLHQDLPYQFDFFLYLLLIFIEKFFLTQIPLKCLNMQMLYLLFLCFLIFYFIYHQFSSSDVFLQNQQFNKNLIFISQNE